MAAVLVFSYPSLAKSCLAASKMRSREDATACSPGEESGGGWLEGMAIYMSTLDFVGFQ